MSRSGIVIGIDDEEVDRPDEAAGATDGRRARTAPPTTVASRLRDEDAGLREVDQLAQRSAAPSGLSSRATPKGPVAQSDEPIDVRDTGRSDQVFHADGSTSQGWRPFAPDRGSTEGSTGLALPSSAASEGARDALTGAADRYCNRFAGGYDTASLRRPPARRPNQEPSPPSVTHQRPVPRDPSRSGVVGGRGQGDRWVGAAHRPGRQPGGFDRSIWRSYWMKLHKVSALAAISVLAFAACGTTGGSALASAGAAAVALPSRRRHQQGHRQDRHRAAPAGQRARGVAADHQRHQACREGGRRRRRRLQDRDPRLGRLRRRAQDGVHDPQTGAQNMTNDRRRARTSSRSSARSTRASPRSQIPISNEAGLLQCSPGEHERGPHEARVRRARHPQGQPDQDQLRPRRHDGRQPGPGGRPVHPRESCKKNRSTSSTDTETFGKGIADNFQKYFEANGGTVVARDGAPKTHDRTTASILTAAKAQEPRGDLLRWRHRRPAARGSSRRPSRPAWRRPVRRP